MTLEPRAVILISPMDITRAALIDGLLERALDLPEPERLPWLEAECAGDPSLAAEVERLLVYAGTEVDDLLEPVRAFVAQVGEGLDGALASGESVGAYRVVRPLGRGGMGLVYLAERSDSTFERQVALKVLPNARSSPEAVRRFEQERRILARLDHPRIARLLDGGVDPRGLPFLALEYVVGEPIDRWCDSRRASVEERLRLVVEIAGAVQAAHQSLVVHRDLKPSNLLVTAEGEVKLLDFGIAKLLDADDSGPGLTVADGRPMTPTYASPEQVNAEPITTASDVYQLGLLLYELLTGLRPQEADTESLSELVALVCHQEPAAPSRSVLAPDSEAVERAARRGASPQSLARRYRRNLDAIVARALAKEPARRYPSAAELAKDLERFLSGQPVEARRASAPERLAKWVRRNPALATAAGLVLASTVGYAVAVTLQARAIERQRVRAELEATKATEVERFVLGLFESSDPEQALGQDVPASELLRRGSERIERELVGQPEVRARLLSSLGAIYGEIGQLAKARELLERAMRQQEGLPGDHRLEIADTEQRLGSALRKSGDLEGAQLVLSRALAGHRAVLAPDTEALARDLAELGIIASALGNTEQAATYYQESLAIHRRRGNEGGIAIALSNLGGVELARGQLPAAESMFRESLAMHRRRFGHRHPKVALLLYNLGVTLRRQKRLAEALPLLEESWAINREVYGPRHPIPLVDQTQFAQALQQAGELDRAQTLYADLVPELRALLQPDDRRLTNAEVGLGQLHVRQGRFREAEALLTSALARRTHLKEHSGQLGGLGPLWLGRAQAGQGRTEEALATWQSGLEQWRDQLDQETLQLYEREIAELASRTAQRLP